MHVGPCDLRRSQVTPMCRVLDHTNHQFTAYSRFLQTACPRALKNSLAAYNRVMSLFTLIAGIAALLVGPIAYRSLTRRGELAAALDGFIFITIGALVLLEALPEAVAAGGLWAWGFLLIGLFGPNALERLVHRAARQTHLLTLLIGGLGLVLHATADGAALGAGSTDNPLLPLAVILHRLPVGLAVWWLLRPSFGARTANAVLALMVLGTLLGYGVGPQVAGAVDTTALAWFQAFVAGSILHVVFNKPHLGDEFTVERNQDIPRHYEGMGNLLGIAVMLGIASLHVAGEHGSTHWDGWHTLLSLALVSAPALLLGYLLAGLLSVFLPGATARWLQGGNGLSQSLRGMAIGLPMPVCSCGVLPLYRKLVDQGAPPAAAFAFLIATPELGIDAIILSLPLLGLDMTILRVVCAAILALFVGWLLGRLARPASVSPASDACCGPEHATNAPDALAANQAPWPQRLRIGLREGFGPLVDTTAPWIIFGLLIAAAAEPLLRAPWLAELSPTVQILAFALIGIPTYVCAAGATPIVAVMLLAGVSPGAALAFLLAGPATNIATFGLIGGLHRRATAALFAIATVGGAVALGLVANVLAADWTGLTQAPAHDHGSSLLQQASLVLLCCVFLAAMYRRGARAFVIEGIRGHHAHG